MKLTIILTLALLTGSDALLSVAHAAPPVAETKPHSPKAGSPERKAILDAMRVPVNEEKKEMLKDVPKKRDEPLVFTVETLTVLGDWAYVVATFTPDFAEGIASAVLHRDKDVWTVKDLSFADDVPHFSALAKKLNAPRELFPKDLESN